MATINTGASANAEPGPSRLRGLSVSESSASSASPINVVEELDDHQMHIQHQDYQPHQTQHGQGQQGTGATGQTGQGQGQGIAGINRNGLRVGEDGEVTRVPAFLTKLFSMVSDPETDKLIYWSLNGDSFLIPNHEQFSQNILPRFFKHKNFSSFVRQLNMYAFHKVPHLQSSSTAESSPEIWEFVNPLFKRNQPELLGRITRRQRGNVPAPAPTRTSARQQAATVSSPLPHGQSSGSGTLYGANGQPLHLITDGSVEGDAGIGMGYSGSSSSNTSNMGQMLVGPQGMIDLAAITSGIQAIQRTQASIGADLKALQSSNEHLWREAMEQREKHKKHQETIDLIVSFLERLFGTDGEGLKGLKEAMRRSGLARGRDEEGVVGMGMNMGMGMESGKKRRRLGLDRMIGDGREGDDRPSGTFTPRINRTRSSRASSQVDLGVDGDTDMETAKRFTTLPNDEASPSASASVAGAGTSKSATPPSGGLAGEPTPPAGTMRPAAMHGSSASGGVGGSASGNAGASGSAPSGVNGTYQSSGTSGYGFDPFAFDPSSSGTGSSSGNGNVNFGALAPYNYSNNTNSTSSSHNNLNIPSHINTSTSTDTQLNSLALMSPGAAQSAAAAFNLDPAILQTTIGSLLQSPAAAQMFLSSLNNSVQGQGLTPMRGALTPSGFGGGRMGQGQYGQGQAYGYTGSGGAMVNGTGDYNGNRGAGGQSDGNGNGDGGGYFSAFSPGADFTSAALGHMGGTSGTSGASGTRAGASTSTGPDTSNQRPTTLPPNANSNTSNQQVGLYDDPTLALLSPLPMPQPAPDALMANQADLMRTYETAAAMEGDMDKLQESIDQLVRSMGLDVTGGMGGQGGQGAQMQGQGMQQQYPGQGQRQANAQAPSSRGNLNLSDIKVEPLDTTPSNTATATAASVTPNTAASSNQAVPSQPPSGMSDMDMNIPMDFGTGGPGDLDLDLNMPDGFDMDAFLNDMAGGEGDGIMGQGGGDGGEGQGAV